MRSITVLLLPLMLTPLFTVAQDKMSCKDLKRLVAIDMSIWNDRTPERSREVYHEDCTDIGHYENLEEKIASVKKSLDENPKLEMKATDILCAENAVTVHYEVSGYSAKHGADFNTSGMYTAHIKDSKYWKMDGKLDVLTPLLVAGYSLSPPASQQGELLRIAKVEEEIWNTGNLDLCNSIYAANYQDYSEGKLTHEGLEAQKKNIQAVREDNEKFSMIYKEMLPGENTITVIWEATGYNKSYKTDFTLRGLSINYIKNGKIFRGVNMRDMLGALTDGGYTLTPPK